MVDPYLLKDVLRLFWSKKKVSRDGEVGYNITNETKTNHDVPFGDAIQYLGHE